MIVERVSGCSWTECPDGVESAAKPTQSIDRLTQHRRDAGGLKRVLETSVCDLANRFNSICLLAIDHMRGTQLQCQIQA